MNCWRFALKKVGFLLLAVAILAVLDGATLTGAVTKIPKMPDKRQVSIEVIADSANTLSASVMVEPGTNARDLMEKLFQMEYADSGRKFVKSIAGFGPRRFKREYWSLEIDGDYAQVGIAEIRVEKSMKLVWRLVAY